MFKRRIGPHPHAGMSATSAVKNCPDIWELQDGTFAVIGVDKTTQLLARCPNAVKSDANRFCCSCALSQTARSAMTALRSSVFHTLI